MVVQAVPLMRLRLVPPLALVLEVVEQEEVEEEVGLEYLSRVLRSGVNLVIRVGVLRNLRVHLEG